MYFLMAKFDWFTFLIEQRFFEMDRWFYFYFYTAFAKNLLAVILFSESKIRKKFGSLALTFTKL